MARDRSHLLTIGGVVAIIAIAVALVLFWPSVPDDDETQIRELVDTQTEHFNKQEWKEMSALCWPQENALTAFVPVEYAFYLHPMRIEAPVLISGIVVNKDIATGKVHVKGTYLNGNPAWEREFVATFRKHDGRWFVDFPTTYDAINAGR